jgi:hypothetical protein
MMRTKPNAGSALPDAPTRTRWTTDAAFLWLLVCAVLGGIMFVLSHGPALLTQDFRCFYAAGQMLRHSRSQLYDLTTQFQWQHAAAGGNMLLPFYHVAYEALLYLPFTPFSYRTAYLLYAACNMLLLWICYVVSPPGNSIFAGSKRPALFFLSFPLLLCCFVGQNALIILLAITVAYNAILNDDDRRAGFLLGLVTFKLPVILPLVFLLTIRRGRRLLTGFLVSSIPVLALSVWIAGISGTREWLRMLGAATFAADQTGELQRRFPSVIVSFAGPVPTNIWLRAMPNLTGLLYFCGSGHLPARAAVALNMAVVVLVLALGVYIQRRARSEAVAFSAGLLCTLLVSPHLHIYDFSSLVLPFLLLTHRTLMYAAILWFVFPPLLYAYGFLTWFAPAVVIPLALLAVCIAEFRSCRPAPNPAAYLAATS